MIFCMEYANASKDCLDTLVDSSKNISIFRKVETDDGQEPEEFHH